MTVSLSESMLSLYPALLRHRPYAQERPEGLSSQENSSSPVPDRLDLSAQGQRFLRQQQQSQEALDRLAFSGDTEAEKKRVARNEASEKVDNIKGRLVDLLQTKTLMSAKALASILAQLSRELKEAVAEYIRNGGSDGGSASVGAVALSAPSSDGSGEGVSSQELSAAPSGQDEGTGQEAGAVSSPQGEGESGQADHFSLLGRAMGVRASSEAVKGDDPFKREVRYIAKTLRALLEEARKHHKKGDVPDHGDVKAVENNIFQIGQMIGGV